MSSKAVHYIDPPILKSYSVNHNNVAILAGFTPLTANKIPCQTANVNKANIENMPELALRNLK